MCKEKGTKSFPTVVPALRGAKGERRAAYFRKVSKKREKKSLKGKNVCCRGVRKRVWLW